MKTVIKIFSFKLAVVGDRILLADVTWFHVGCIEVKVYFLSRYSVYLIPIVVLGTRIN